MGGICVDGLRPGFGRAGRIQSLEVVTVVVTVAGAGVGVGSSCDGVCDGVCDGACGKMGVVMQSLAASTLLLLTEVLRVTAEGDW